MSEVKLFSLPGCGGCMATEREFKKKGIDYVKINVMEDPEAREFLMGLGYQGAPVVYVSEDLHWMGYKPELIGTL